MSRGLAPGSRHKCRPLRRLADAGAETHIQRAAMSFPKPLQAARIERRLPTPPRAEVSALAEQQVEARHVSQVDVARAVLEVEDIEAGLRAGGVQRRR